MTQKTVSHSHQTHQQVLAPIKGLRASTRQESAMKAVIRTVRGRPTAYVVNSGTTAGWGFSAVWGSVSSDAPENVPIAIYGEN